MKYVAVIVMLLTGMYGCGPKKNTAGLGGSNTLVVFPQHHGRPINHCAVFLKFNTQDAPGSDTTAYDARFKGDLHSNHINCPGLNAGNYYVYVYGWDTLINLPVQGGLPLNLTTTSNLVVPVSE